MNRSKRVAALLGGILLVGAGLGPFGMQPPRAGERQTPEPGQRGIRRVEAKGLPPAGSVDLSCQMHQPATILWVVSPGTAVNKGDLLVELDVSDLIDKRVQQVFQTRKTETEWIVARESQSWEKQAASGQIALAEKALRLAQGQLKAFTEAEYPRRLVLAEGEAQLARHRVVMAEERYLQLRDRYETEKDQDIRVFQEAQLALQEAKLQGATAAGDLTSLKDFGHPNRVAELELAVAQKEFDLARAKDALSAATAKGGALVSLAEMSYQREANRLAELDDEILKSKIYAPQDGTVVYPDDAGAAAIGLEAVVRPGQVLIRLLPATPPKP